jgi:hypothetical protein
MPSDYHYPGFCWAFLHPAGKCGWKYVCRSMDYQKSNRSGRLDAMRRKKGELIAGLVLLTVGSLFILDRLLILEIYISWPLILVAVGVALFLLNPHSLASWIVGGVGVVLFIK